MLRNDVQQEQEQQYASVSHQQVSAEQCYNQDCEKKGVDNETCHRLGAGILCCQKKNTNSVKADSVSMDQEEEEEEEGQANSARDPIFQGKTRPSDGQPNEATESHPRLLQEGKTTTCGLHGGVLSWAGSVEF